MGSDELGDGGAEGGEGEGEAHDDQSDERGPAGREGEAAEEGHYERSVNVHYSLCGLLGDRARKEGATGWYGMVYHSTGADQGNVGGPSEWLVGTVVVLEDAEREGEACR